MFHTNIHLKNGMRESRTFPFRTELQTRFTLDQKNDLYHKFWWWKCWLYDGSYVGYRVYTEFINFCFVSVFTINLDSPTCIGESWIYVLFCFYVLCWSGITRFLPLLPNTIWKTLYVLLCIDRLHRKRKYILSKYCSTLVWAYAWIIAI